MAISPSKRTHMFRVLRYWPSLAFVGLLLMLSYKIYSGSSIELIGQNVTFGEFTWPGGPRLPQYSAITPEFINSVWPLVALGLGLSLLALRFIAVIAESPKRGPITQTEPESGTSAVEFVLVLPILAVMLLMILQIALLVQAKFVVNYAAFCAVRAAITVIPDEVASNGLFESRNRVGKHESSEKVEMIHRSAALPLTAISPVPGLSGATGLPVLTNPQPIAQLIKLAPFDVGPESMMGQVMLRAPYAYHPENTVVEIFDGDGNEAHNFRDHDWVTVKVSYRYYLAVPFAKRLFGTAYSNDWWNILFGTDYYYPVVEQYTLPVDGEPMLP
jgi:hypothetical protein